MGNKLSYPEVDLSGKVAIVTGGNTGIGYETAKGLARLGAHTFIACRSKERAEGAIERLKAELDPASSKKEEEKAEGKEGKAEEDAGNASLETEGEGVAEGETAPMEGEEGEGGKEGEEGSKEAKIKVEYIPLDLSSFQSTIDCVRTFKEKNLPLHILINNAAIAFTPFNKTSDGFEAQFQVNHLGPMLLTLELLPLLLDTAASSGDGRIVFVSSSAHTMAPPFDVNQLDKQEADYKRFKGYCTSKACNVMTGYALQRRLADKNITVSSLDPGNVNTEISRGTEDSKVAHFFQTAVMKTVCRTPEKGAATSLNCAVNPDLNSQQHFYYASCQPKQPTADARNVVFQEEMWKKSFQFMKDFFSPETVENYGPKEDSEVASGEGEVATGNKEGGGVDEIATGNHGVATSDETGNQGGDRGDETTVVRDTEGDGEAEHERRGSPAGSEEGTRGSVVVATGNLQGNEDTGNQEGDN